MRKEFRESCAHARPYLSTYLMSRVGASGAREYTHPFNSLSETLDIYCTRGGTIPKESRFTIPVFGKSSLKDRRLDS